MKRKQDSSFWVYLNGVTNENTALISTLEQGEIVKCKLCGSISVVRYGLSKGVQCWWCKDCNHKFVDNRAAPGMKIPKEQIAYALSMYYEGMGFKAICRDLQQKYNSYPSDSTVYNWIQRFTKKAIMAEKRERPKVSENWIAISTPVKVGDENVWFWDILDVKTRFLLASRVSKKLTTNHARVTLSRAIKKAGKLPKMVLTDQLSLYIEGLKLDNKSESRRIIARKIVTDSDARLFEIFRTNLKARAIIMKGFKNLKSARTIIRGWPIYYNYLRQHELVSNNTPAYHADIRSHLKVKLR